MGLALSGSALEVPPRGVSQTILLPQRVFAPSKLNIHKGSSEDKNGGSDFRADLGVFGWTATLILLSAK